MTAQTLLISEFCLLLFGMFMRVNLRKVSYSANQKHKQVRTFFRLCTSFS